MSPSPIFTLGYLLNLHKNRSITEEQTLFNQKENIKTLKEFNAALDKNKGLVLFRSSNEIEFMIKQQLQEIKGDKVMIIISKDPEFTEAISELVENLKYDEDYQTEHKFSYCSGNHHYYFDNYLKDVRIQIFIGERMSMVAVDRYLE